MFSDVLLAVGTLDGAGGAAIRGIGEALCYLIFIPIGIGVLRLLIWEGRANNKHHMKAIDEAIEHNDIECAEKYYRKLLKSIKRTKISTGNALMGTAKNKYHEEFDNILVEYAAKIDALKSA